MLFDLCLMILEPSQLSSLKPYSEIFPKSLLFRMDEENLEYYTKNPHTKKNKYMVDGITNEFQIASKRWSYRERDINEIIRTKLNGKAIPSKGFQINITAASLATDVNNMVTLDFDLSLPSDTKRDSALRLWLAHDYRNIPPELRRTIMYSVPFKFLSSKIENDKSHPPRGDFWVYRVRFYITDKDKLKQSTINVYQNGYIGITSRTPFERFNEHYYGKTNKLPKSLYNCWSHIDERKVNHIVSFEILDRCNTQKEMEDLEKLYIDKYNTLKNGFNSVPGGDDGIAFLKSLGIDCDDIENKDNYISKLPKGITNSKRPHLVREHMREYKTNTYCLVSEHYRNLPKEAEALLDT